jgi:hypothetical protein
MGSSIFCGLFATHFRSKAIVRLKKKSFLMKKEKKLTTFFVAACCMFRER